MRLPDLIERATKEPEFAKELEARAREAALAGSDSEEWENYMGYFAEDKRELARLTPRVKVRGVNFDTRAMTLATTTHGIQTIFHTTTQTLSLFCHPPKQHKGELKKRDYQSKDAGSGTKAKKASTKKAR